MRLTFVVLFVAAACVEKPNDLFVDPQTPLVTARAAPEPAVVQLSPGLQALPERPLAQPPTMYEPPPPPPRVILSPTLTTDPPAATRIGEVLNVKLHVLIKNSAGPHEVSAEFVAPGGIHYERRAVTIDGPLEQEKSATFVLPVAGTMISEQHLSGTWSVKLFHDADALSSPIFELSP